MGLHPKLWGQQTKFHVQSGAKQVMGPNASISTSLDWKIFSASQILIKSLCTLLEIELNLAGKR